MKISTQSRLNILVLERRLKTATAFAKAMTIAGYKLSTSQAARYLNEEPTPAMNVAFIETACNVFQCLPSELFDIKIEMTPEEANNAQQPFPQHVKRIIKAAEAPTSSAPPTAISSRKKLPWEEKYGIAGPSLKPLPSTKK